MESTGLVCFWKSIHSGTPLVGTHRALTINRNVYDSSFPEVLMRPFKVLLPKRFLRTNVRLKRIVGK